MSDTLKEFESTGPAAVGKLLEIAERYGTPTYAFDIRRIQAQAEKLRMHLPAEVGILYSLKANASLGICDVLAREGIGADVASAGELATATAAGFPAGQLFVAGPYKLAETVAQLREFPEATISIDSPSELQALSAQQLTNPAVLRLRPDFDSSAVVAAGSESRFGFTRDDLVDCRDLLHSSPLQIIGFHVFAGSQVLKAESVIEHFRRALDLSLRGAEIVGITPGLINLGGGFGIPYASCEPELELAPIGEELKAMVDRAAPARLVLELGRYLVAQAGWYLTSVLGQQTNQARRAVVVDGGTHQRADLCGLCLRSKANPPIVLDAPDSPATPTDVLGCLSLPADILAEASPLPELKPGNWLAFATAGAYGLWSSPALFHGSPLPAEVAFDDTNIYLMRDRRPAQSILDGQRHVAQVEAAAKC